MKTKGIKKNSEVWNLAKKLARRKNTLWQPVELCSSGLVVKVQGLLYGNTWNLTVKDLKDLSEHK